MSRLPLQLVVFDLDDTLYPERQFVRSGYTAVARHLRETLDRNEAFEDWLWQRFEAGRYAGAFDALNKQFSLGLSHEDIVACVNVYRLHTPPAIEPYNGMAALLDRLAGQYRLGIISDGPSRTQRQKLAATGLADYFDEVLISCDFEPPAGKPDATMYELIAQRLRVPHRACAYVGDNPSKDFLAPNTLGWRTLHYLRPQQVHAPKPPPTDGQPQVTVRTDAELLAALDT
ncbi:MAG: HAD-IA family hydrolase [Planctomycetes bacterium]|nr:HAD family hydrolase [Phycisphaerae bacterium]NBB96327.1 HAD-IA family hydrolase [Planctomycetota bacterium]